MTKEQAEQLYPLVNSRDWNAYMLYQLDRVKALHDELEWQQSDYRIREIQGRIAEIRESLKLVTKVNELLTQA